MLLTDSWRSRPLIFEKGKGFSANIRAEMDAPTETVGNNLDTLKSGIYKVEQEE